jgi:N-acetylmuramoyl-L-alanine amidase
MDTNGWDDIGYNFLVGEDGNAYEGRGWDNVGAHVKGFNTDSLGIAVIGNFNGRKPAHRALTAVKNLIACGVTKGKLAENYKLHGYTGQKLHDLISTWPQYSAKL